MITPRPRRDADRRDSGFAMVALLVAMSVAAIWMASALPAWRQQAQRQREDDLIFRGEQYARAIVLYQDKNRGALPPNIDILVSGHYLRKKWKDPITNQDFIPVGNGMASPAGQSPVMGGAPQPPRGAGPATSQPGRGGQPPGQGQPLGSAQQVGIFGVRSTSTATSIKIYQGQQQYSQWPFDAALIRARMGRTLPQGNPQQGRPGGPGGDRGMGPGGAPGRGGGPGIGPGGGPVRGGGPAGPGGAPVPPGGRSGGS